MSEGTSNTQKIPEDRPGEGDGSFSFRGNEKEEGAAPDKQVVSVDDIKLTDKAPKQSDAEQPPKQEATPAKDKKVPVLS